MANLGPVPGLGRPTGSPVPGRQSAIYDFGKGKRAVCPYAPVDTSNRGVTQLLDGHPPHNRFRFPQPPRQRRPLLRRHLRHVPRRAPPMGLCAPRLAPRCASHRAPESCRPSSGLCRSSRMRDRGRRHNEPGRRGFAAPRLDRATQQTVHFSPWAPKTHLNRSSPWSRSRSSLWTRLRNFQNCFECHHPGE